MIIDVVDKNSVNTRTRYGTVQQNAFFTPAFRVVPKPNASEEQHQNRLIIINFSPTSNKRWRESSINEGRGRGGGRAERATRAQ